MLRGRIQRSKYLELQDFEGQITALVRFELDGEDIVLYDKDKVEISSQKILNSQSTQSQDAFDSIVERAEQIARGQHLLTLKYTDPKSVITDNLEIEVFAVKDVKKTRQIEVNGIGHIYPGDRICIRLQNSGDKRCMCLCSMSMSLGKSRRSLRHS